MKSWLKKRTKLFKYSLAANPASEVLAHVKNNPFSDVDPAQLAKLIESYKPITVDATSAEIATPDYKAAQDLIVEIEQTKGKLEKQTLKPTRTVTRQPSEPKRKKKKTGPAVEPVMGKQFPPAPEPKMDIEEADPVTRIAPDRPPLMGKGTEPMDIDPTTGLARVGVLGYGLRKKPKKRAKRSSKRAKKQKKRTESDENAPSEPETALEKWDRQTRIFRKMRL